MSLRPRESFPAYSRPSSNAWWRVALPLRLHRGGLSFFGAKPSATKRQGGVGHGASGVEKVLSNEDLAILRQVLNHHGRDAY